MHTAVRRDARRPAEHLGLHAVHWVRRAEVGPDHASLLLRETDVEAPEPALGDDLEGRLGTLDGAVVDVQHGHPGDGRRGCHEESGQAILKVEGAPHLGEVVLHDLGQAVDVDVAVQRILGQQLQPPSYEVGQRLTEADAQGSPVRVRCRHFDLRRVPEAPCEVQHAAPNMCRGRLQVLLRRTEEVHVAGRRRSAIWLLLRAAPAKKTPRQVQLCRTGHGRLQPGHFGAGRSEDGGGGGLQPEHFSGSPESRQHVGRLVLDGQEAAEIDDDVLTVEFLKRATGLDADGAPLRFPETLSQVETAEAAVHEVPRGLVAKGGVEEFWTLQEPQAAADSVGECDERPFGGLEDSIKLEVTGLLQARQEVQDGQAAFSYRLTLQAPAQRLRWLRLGPCDSRLVGIFVVAIGPDELRHVEELLEAAIVCQAPGELHGLRRGTVDEDLAGVCEPDVQRRSDSKHELGVGGGHQEEVTGLAPLLHFCRASWPVEHDAEVPEGGGAPGLHHEAIAFHAPFGQLSQQERAREQSPGQPPDLSAGEMDLDAVGFCLQLRDERSSELTAMKVGHRRRGVKERLEAGSTQNRILSCAFKPLGFRVQSVGLV